MSLKKYYEVKFFLLLFLLFSIISASFSQGMYEIEVYESETVDKGKIMVELHSNFTASGNTKVEDGVIPTHKALHETVEIIYGVTDWFELGGYFFTSTNPGEGFGIAGYSIKPRFRIPESWKWPVGVSVSDELQYMNPAYSSAQWIWEFRPIIDKWFGKIFVCFNPSMEVPLTGIGGDKQMVFSPNFKLKYELTKNIVPGIEYYGELGPWRSFEPMKRQEHQLAPSIDLCYSEDWEFNFGVMFGLTDPTDKIVFKMILGHRF